MGNLLLDLFQGSGKAQIQEITGNGKDQRGAAKPAITQRSCAPAAPPANCVGALPPATP